MLKKIHIENFLGITRASIDTSSSLTLIAGPNAAGKSSVENAMRFALTGEIARVALKKEYGQLVKAGAGNLAIKIETAKGDFDLKITKSGKIEGARPFKADDVMRTCLDPHHFAALSATNRKAMLHSLLAGDAAESDVAAELLKREIPEEVVETLRVPLLGGFEPAAQFAQDKLRDLRSDWKSLTGQTYGEVLAESWKPTVAVDPYDIEAGKAEIAELEKQSAALLGEIGAEQAKPVVTEGRAEMLRAKLAGLQKDLEVAQADEASQKAMIEECAYILAEIEATFFYCPECNASLTFHPDEGTTLAAPITDERRIELNAKLVELRGKSRTLDDWRQRENTARTMIKHTEDELRRIELLGARDEKKLAKLQADVSKIGAKRDDIREKMVAARDARLNYESAMRNAERAGTVHTQIMEWKRAAQLLSPDGIPGEILADLLKRFNAKLRSHCVFASFPVAAINADCDITIDGRHYLLCSESERWRADAVIAMVIAEYSEFGIVLMDRFDVIEPSSRGAVIAWLQQCDPTHTVLFGTLKNPPVIEGARCYWVEDGKATETIAEEAAA